MTASWSIQFKRRHTFLLANNSKSKSGHNQLMTAPTSLILNLNNSYRPTPCARTSSASCARRRLFAVRCPADQQGCGAHERLKWIARGSARSAGWS